MEDETKRIGRREYGVLSKEKMGIRGEKSVLGGVR